MHLTLGDLRHDYRTVVQTVLLHGSDVEARGQLTRELTGVTLLLQLAGRPWSECLPVGVGRSLRTGLAAIEALQLMAGTFDATLVLAAAPQFTAVLEDPATLEHGAYGPRLDWRLDAIVDELRRDPGSRRAFASIWRPNDLVAVGDRPCTLGLQYLVRNHDLHAFTYMRSNDVWLGLPYDVWSFTQLQHTLARVLEYPVGDYHHTVTSLHLYERDVEKVRHLHPEPTAERAGLPTGLVLPPPPELADAPGPVQPAPAQWDDVRQLARALLTGTATTAQRDANRWYATQVDGVRARAGLPVPRDPEPVE